MQRQAELLAALGKVIVDHADMNAHEVIAALLALARTMVDTCPDPQQRQRLKHLLRYTFDRWDDLKGPPPRLQ